MRYSTTKTAALALLILSTASSCEKEYSKPDELPVAATVSVNASTNNSKKERTLLFISNREYYLTSPNSFDLFASDDDGSNVVRLTHSGNAGRGSWSANGQHVAFAAGAANDRDIFVMNANGHGLRNITNSSGFDEDWPEWSVTGNDLIFSSRWDFTTGTPLTNHEIFTYSMEDGSFTRLTTRPEDDKWPTWSPDGSRVAFQSIPVGGTTDVYVMHADGSQVTRLTHHAGFDQMPTWSPDGTGIAFMSTRNGNPNVYTMNADGSAQTALTTHTAADARPSWSRETNKIFFASQRISGRWNLFMMNPDGSGQTAITSQAAYHNDYPFSR